MPTTLADIAEALGVSAMTVSRAINNHPAINAETRERVLKVARRMEYRPNHNARGLVTNRAYLLGLVAPDLMHSYYAELAKAIESIARPAGYEVIICNTEEDAEKEVVEVTALRRRTDGLIIASSIAQDKAGVYRKLIREGAKLVFLDRHFDRIQAPAVVTDNALVGLLATEHLINLGHLRIGHLRGPNVRVAIDRLEGYRQALRKHKIRFDERLARACGFFEHNGYEAMRSWIAEGETPTAIFAANDPSAIGAMTALHEAGVKVPEEVAIVGAGAIHYGKLLRTPLTTVDWDLAEMGRQAAQLLIGLIKGDRVKSAAQRNVVVRPGLVVRNSCGAVRSVHTKA